MTKILVGPNRFETTIKRSRFIAHVGKVSTEEETLQFYESVVDPGASHNCWAWRINARHRFNDDGEPGGTAGRPILAVLEGRDLDQTMVVVTRYYGGIKLGVGGLVRAYAGTASKCLDQTDTIDQIIRIKAEIKAAFELSAPVHQLMDQYDAQKLAETYDADGVQWLIEAPRENIQPMRLALEEISRGSAKFWLKR